MSSNSMMSPIGPARILPPVAPMQQMAPYTIRIDIVPTMPQQIVDSTQMQPGLIYNMPQTSLYEPHKADDKKAVERSVENKKSETKALEAKEEDKKFETTLAQVLAAQSGVQPVQAAPANTAEVAQKDNKSEAKKEVKHNRPEIVAPEKMKASIDIDGLMDILNSTDYEEQADAMEAISEVTIYAPERAGELLDSKVVDALTGIMEKDTSAMQGNDKVLAERNKEYAMFTTATLQKLFSDQVKQEGNVTVPTKDLIGMSSIVKNLATSPNESVREAAVASLGYMNKPEYKRDLASLIGAAANDPSATVRAQANKHLGKVLA